MLTHHGQLNVHLLSVIVYLLQHGVVKWLWLTTLMVGVTQLMIHIEDGVTAITKV